MFIVRCTENRSSNTITLHLDATSDAAAVIELRKTAMTYQQGTVLYEQALDAAHRSIDDGSIEEFSPTSDEYGYRKIYARTNKGWFTWFNEADEYEPHGGNPYP